MEHHYDAYADAGESAPTGCESDTRVPEGFTLAAQCGGDDLKAGQTTERKATELSAIACKEESVRSCYVGAVGVVLAVGIALSHSAPARAQGAPLEFKIYCSRCHGENGKGDGPDAATLKTHPRNFTDCGKMATISDATMFQAIKNGGASVNLSSDMPAWSAGLDDDQIHDLMKYIRGFCKK
jgi:cytochrome c553